jgi:hypothetical protein
MRQGKLKLLGLLVLAMLMTLQTGCLSGEDKENLEDVFNPDQEVPAEPDKPEVQAGCQLESFKQPEAEISRKIDILFLTDTSSSLDQERSDIANGIDSFVEALPDEVDYNIGVLLAHSHRSHWQGRPYVDGGEPAILSSENQDLDEIQSDLHDKLTRSPSDGYSDGGEMGLSSLIRSFDSDRLSEWKDAGFFREDAAFALVFISDENDICADYPLGVDPVPDGQGIEPIRKANDCDGITPQAALDLVKAEKGDLPTVISGIVYDDVESYPRHNENEYGYGYIDMIELASGLSVDLASGEYADGLSNIGTLATQKLNLITEYELGKPADEVDASSIEVRVDGNLVGYNYVAETNTVHLDSAGGALSTVDTLYCDKEIIDDVDPICLAGEFQPKSVIRVAISSDVRFGTGAQVQSAIQSLGYEVREYSDAEIEAGDLIEDNNTVLILSRKVLLDPLSQAYVSGVRDFVAAGGSILAEYDGAGLLFDNFVETNSITQNMSPPIDLYGGTIAGGGALLPINYSTTYVDNQFHPLMNGVNENFLIGLRSAFALSEYNSDFLEPVASFLANGDSGQLPQGYHPAIVAGACGQGRIALFMMNYFAVIDRRPVDRLFHNALKWLVGRDPSLP